ncbi:hypothetical protein P885DRAFT_59577 [Corynascus similis CBS 632.67]
MAIEGATQALVAAFFFGIVLNAASAALVLYVKGYGVSTVFRDSQRLVLVLFLLSAALWAQIDFITILLDITTSAMPCQIGTIFATVFDQFARFSIEQFLLWALNTGNDTKIAVTQLIPQALLLARFLAGAVFIGFTRPQTDDFCVATNSALPVGILVAALDGTIIFFLLIRAYSKRGAANENQSGKGVDADQARALMAVLLGLVFWTGTSVPMLLGFSTLALATKTALPAGGLLVVIIFVATGAGTLLTTRKTSSRPPEAPSPRRINISRDVSTSDTDYPPTRFEDLKEAALRSSRTFINPREVPRAKDETSIGFAMGFEENNAIPKAGLVDFGKGKIAISHPIIQQNGNHNPFAKIALMGLEEAAAADRERRARGHKDEGAVVDRRSAARSMGMAPEEMLKRAVSLKRKEVASVSIRESVFPGGLQAEDAAVARTTSAQLSPGGEGTRRRSPRPSVQEEPAKPRSASPAKSEETIETSSQSLQNRPLTSQQPLLRQNIRPSRTLPPSPPTPSPEPTKTPLQRRPTIGLPSNPRARGLKFAEEPGSQHRTILFLNNIEYNDPSMVNAIIKTAGNPSMKTVLPTETPNTSLSVVNRPRPIPRKPADSPAQSSPAFGHRRTKSGGSMGRRTLLTASPGSPTNLPPLPALPMRSATVAARPHPNDTKSMTFEEKVTLFFPNPPSTKAIKRRSSVPDVPRIPASYFDMDTSPSEQYGRHPSNRTTKTFGQTESVSEVDEIQPRPGKMLVKTAGEAGTSRLRAFGDEVSSSNLNNQQQASQTDGKRKSSPVIPPEPPRVSRWTETTYDRSDDEGTNWSSLNSPEIAIGVPVMQRLGLPASIQMAGHQDTRGSQLSFADNRSRETLPIMLDISTVKQAETPPVSAPAPEPEEPAAVTPELPTWHRRVGDECPTFSARKTVVKPRKMPPPAPLPLHTVSLKRVLAIQTEPSPLESPADAIRQIQAQLKKLDELPQATPESASRRMALLEDLEREMGQQAEHWEEIKHDIGRDSISTLQTTSPSVLDSRHASVASTVNVARESVRRSIGPEREPSLAAQMRGTNDLKIPKIPEAPVQTSVSPKLSKWQKRLTEAQMDYMDAKLLRTSNVNFMQVSRAQLASPTPPYSDDSEIPPMSGFDDEISNKHPSEVQTESVTLWTPVPKVATPTGLLWTAPVKRAPEPEVPLPGLSLRPAQRKEWRPLQIESNQLWRKPYNRANRATSGLWRPLWASAAPPAEPLVRVASKSGSTSQKPPRPVTQRPPRRNKRVTLLPDILESPEPLPDKRGTLGIFQFPWGEKSDTASIQPRPSMYMAMPGTMTTGGPSIAVAGSSRQTQSTDYSSSFFDDYDDEDIARMDSDEEASDDEFDDSTLWEIASLLKTDAVPSRNSLLPPQFHPVVDSYAEETGSDEEEQSIVIGLATPLEALSEQQRDSATLESSTLMILEDALESKTPTQPTPRVGLPANPKASLRGYATPVTPELAPDRVSPRIARHSPEVQQIQAVNVQQSAGLWSPPSPAYEASARGGLYVPGHRRSSYRGTSEEPAALHMRRTPRPTQQKPIERLSSTGLWTVHHAVHKRERNWILGEQPKHRERRVQRPHFTREDWEAALQEAIAASRPTVKKFNRIAATPADWEAALKQAIAASRPTAKKLKRIAATPTEWEAALQEAIAASRPIAKKPKRIAATPAEWEAALQEAILLSNCRPASNPPVVRQTLRPQSHSSSWSQAGRDDEIHSIGQAEQRKKEDARATNEAPIEVPVSFPAAPQSPTKFTNDSIQAQIEALEQERLFVERAAQEEYRRRTSMAPPVAFVEQPVMAAEELTGLEAVQALQRRLSQRIRQSLVFAQPAPALAHEGLNEKSMTKDEGRIVSRVSSEPAEAKTGKGLLWNPLEFKAKGVSTGLWSANADRGRSLTALSVKEDAFAASQRARGRKVLQEKERMQEILAQMDAVERGENPFVHFAGMELWAGREKSPVARLRDWLHSECVSRSREAASTSKQQLWTSPARSRGSSSSTGLWAAPVTASSSLTPSLSGATIAVFLQERMHNPRRRQEAVTHIDEVQSGAEMWSQKSSAASQGSMAKRDWLHSACVPKARVTGSERKLQKLWAGPLRSHETSSPTGLWEMPSADRRLSVSSSPDDTLVAPSPRAKSRSPRRQDTPTQSIEVEGSMELWSSKSSRPTSPESINTQGWLHSVCVSSASTSPSPSPSPMSSSGYLDQQRLWTPPSSSSSSSIGSPRSDYSTGLWTASGDSATAAYTSNLAAMVEAEDGFAASERARRRKAMQELQRMQEVLAQIAAMEKGLNPTVNFAGMKLWTATAAAGAAGGSGGRVMTSNERDWLHSLCVRPKRGVMLRY